MDTCIIMTMLTKMRKKNKTKNQYIKLQNLSVVSFKKNGIDMKTNY